MNIYLNSDFYAKPDRTLLGYVGETNTRTVTFYNLAFRGADSYSMIIEYEDGVKYEVEIIQESFKVGGSLLRSPQKVKCQLLAKAAIDGTNAYRLVKKSNIFYLEIGSSIDGEPAPVPAYEQTLSLLDRIRALIDGDGAASGDVASLITEALSNAIENDIEQQ